MQKVSPLLSLILPSYNHAHYLADSLESIFSNCSYPFELIVIDDGSTDNTQEILAKWQSDQGLINIYQENQGISSALNKGFSEARGLFFSWTSADNLFQDFALDRMLEFLLQNPNIGMTYTNVRLIDESGQKLINSTYRPADSNSLDSSILELPRDTENLAHYCDNFINACFMYRAQLHHQIGAYRADYRGFEDYDFWLRISSIAKIKHIGSPKPYYQYRIHPQSLTSEINSNKLAQDQRISVKKAKRIIDGIDEPLLIDLQSNSEISEHFINCLSKCLRLSNVETKQTPASTTDNLDIDFSISLTASKEEEESQTTLKASIENKSSRQFSVWHPELSSFTLWNCQNALRLESTALDPDSFQSRSMHLFAPLKRASILKRARTANFSAIVSSANARAKALIFSPHIEEAGKELLDSYAKLIAQSKSITFVSFCQNKGEREFSDHLNLLLSDNENYRIIDTRNSTFDSDNPFTQEAYLPMLYALSSVDFLIDISMPSAELDFGLTARLKCALAALAGRNFLSFTSSDFDYSLALYRSLLPIPNLILNELKPDFFEDEKTIHKLTCRPSESVLDSWLDMQTEFALGNTLKRFIISI